MKVIIYGTKADSDTLLTLMKSQSAFASRCTEFFCTSDYDTYLKRMEEQSFDVVIAFTDQAESISEDTSVAAAMR